MRRLINGDSQVTDPKFSGDSQVTDPKLVLIGSIGVGLGFSPGLALAHIGHEIQAERWWAAWNWPPLVIANLVAVTALYVWCWRRQPTVDKELANSRRVGEVATWRAWVFAAAILTLCIALLSPLDSLSERLGWVHMVQHTVLMMVAAPLFIAGAPGQVILRALPRKWRRRTWRLKRWSVASHLPWYGMRQPIVVWVLFGLTLWIWHLPVLYQAALQISWVHDVQHLAFFLTSCLFWQALLHPLRNRRLDVGLGVLYLFLASVHSTALGVLMAVSPVVWYPYYKTTTPAFGIDPLADQQLAGYIMWMPACMIYAAVAVTLFAAWLRDLSEQPTAELIS